jgi:signal transduction histidine kinase
MPSRTWPVFVLGLCTLLLLICVPGLFLLARTHENSVEVQGVQRQYDTGVRTIQSVSMRIVNGSLLVREFLLDSSPVNAPTYRKQFEQNRAEVIALLHSLRRQLSAEDQTPLDRLSADLVAYSAEVLPIFEWSPEERRERSTWFLRQQQRLRRDTLLATAGHLAELHKGNYERQQRDFERTQLAFRDDLQRLVLFATLLGVAVAAATVFRIYRLERQSSHQQLETEQARAELQTLSHQLLRAQEFERRSLSRELHDQVGQTLTALRMELGALERLRDSEPSRFQQHLSEAKILAEGTLRSVRDIAAGLRPSLLDDLGLGPALELEIRDFMRRTEHRRRWNTRGK